MGESPRCKRVPNRSPKNIVAGDGIEPPAYGLYRVARCDGQQRDAIQTEAPSGVNFGGGLCWCSVRGVAPAADYFFSDTLVAT